MLPLATGNGYRRCQGSITIPRDVGNRLPAENE